MGAPLLRNLAALMLRTPEQQARERIDQQLARAGWTFGSRMVWEEYRLGRGATLLQSPSVADEIADYVLTNRQGGAVAVVEAKRSSRDPMVGQRQAADYADLLHSERGVRPFIFLANGQDILFWHRDRYPPRRVSGFYTSADLERLRWLDAHRHELAEVPSSERIVNRPYQFDAIRAVTERLTLSQRRFLLVMATGTGKTRTVIALVDLLLRARWIQRVLFLADRRELVKQALDAFKEHLPDTPRARIEDGEVDPSARIHVGTYPGMMSAYRGLSPGYYDLIIADESHRSIYRRYRQIFDHFDALHVGLTATPTDFIDHNTFKLFECDDGRPTYLYGYDEAVRDRYLVPYRVHAARTGFQIDGIKSGSLPEPLRQQLVDQDIDPDDLNFEGTDLERTVSNTGTSDAIVREFVDYAIKDGVGTVPAKSIIFAVSHAHALELLASFNRCYPDLQRRGFAKIIDSHMERVEKDLEDFKVREYPRVAISVDMLDTGIDVPSIRNLVFAKPVFSQVKFWQMVGRGTRTLPHAPEGQEKTEFLILDHWDNFAYFKLSPEGKAPASAEPLPTRLFRLRLEKLLLLSGRPAPVEAEAVLRVLQGMLISLPEDNINITPHRALLRELGAAPTWLPLDEERLHLLRDTIAPLLQFGPGGSLPVLSFENLTEQLANAWMRGDRPEQDRLRAGVLTNLDLLPKELPEVAAESAALAFARSDAFWEHLSYARITDIQTRFAPLMKWRLRNTPEIVRFTLPDSIAKRQWITFGPAGEGAFVSTYRRQVEDAVRAMVDTTPVLQRLRDGADLDGDDVQRLAALLNRADLFVTEERLREVYDLPAASLADLLRGILTGAGHVDGTLARFDAWVAVHPLLNTTQLRYLRTLRQALLSRTLLTVESLGADPFRRIGDPAVLFTPEEWGEIMQLALAA